MTDPTQASAERADGRRSVDDILRELEQALSRQLQWARSDNHNGDLPDSATVSQLAEEAAGLLAGQPHPDAGRLERISRLQGQLTLTLAARKQDHADRLTRLRRGKTSLRAYAPGR